MLTRRSFLQATVGAIAAAALPRAAAQPSQAKPFLISLAQWSHHKAFQGRAGVEKIDPLDFAKISMQRYGIDAIEYVNSFYKQHKQSDDFLKDLRKAADDHGVTSVLIMCDGEGNLGDPDEAKRLKAVDNHKRWVEWAKFLGCHSIRVNAHSSGTAEEQMKLAADGLRRLCEFGDSHGINVIVENHGGLSSNGEWLAGLIKATDHPRAGTLPDFGNFWLRRPDPKKAGDKGEQYDRYKGVDELMPWAKGVSAKSHDFDDRGEEVHTDYRKMMDIVVRKHKYSSYVGIEYEGSKLSEEAGIKATLKLLQAIQGEFA